ncbi:hypothetical protein CYMTET_35599 [Cymbomonas tetramitiformis]|uniref:E3 ubiquitin-protein ligase CHFR n=1 Tax=Cymbomonas tetramitiformis TaxID=36881 RepID=A0AAE0F8M5_9CHLO|nr:hypothetical protein CYMTET_35599 [Cymbomonas tetramitiformis]|eukprot:gene8-10_t
MTAIRSTAYLKHLLDCEPGHPELIRPDILLHPFFNIDKPFVSIGRHLENDVCLQSDRMPYLLSSYHCRIEVAFEQNRGYVYTLGDEETTNGCYVGSELLPPGGRKVITHGTILGLGGPRNVCRDGRTQRNPFRFAFMLFAAEDPPPPLMPTRNMQQLLEAMMCLVCRETMMDAHILPCGHSYCGACIWTWSETRLTCPICRAPFRTPIENPLLEEFHQLMLAQSFTLEEAEERNDRREAFVHERTRMKRNWAEMESATRQNLNQQTGAAGLPPGLFEGVLASFVGAISDITGRPHGHGDVFRVEVGREPPAPPPPSQE